MSDAPQTDIQHTHRTDADHLLMFLAERELPCPACGYNLRMLSKPVCPECGLPLKLTVGSDAPFKRAWAITLILNAMIAGAGVFFLLITISSGGPGTSEFFEFFWYFAAMAWIPTPLIILGFRKWLCSRSSEVQYILLGLSVVWLIVLGLSLLSSFH